MKTKPAALLTAEAQNDVLIDAAFRFDFAAVRRVWSGVGQLTLAGEGGPFTGLDAPGLVMPVGGEMGGGANGLRLILSGLDPTVAAEIEAETYHQRRFTYWWVWHRTDGVTFLHAQVMARGRVDTLLRRDEPGGDSTVQLALEGAGRDLNRAGARVRSDADQRTHAGATDGLFKHVSVAGERTTYWGGKDPAVAGQVVNGGAIGGGGRDIVGDGMSRL